jgi:hypothetical protein
LAISAIRNQISVYLSLMARTCGRSDENSIEKQRSNNREEKRQ